MKSLEDIMGFYNLKGEDIKGHNPISADERARILQRTLDKAALIKNPKKAHRKRLIMLAAACITIFALGAVSFAATTLNGSLLNFFHPEGQNETDLLNSLGTIIDKQVTENGLTIDVKEAVGDSNAVYVLFDLIGPKNMPLDQEQYAFVSQFVDIDNYFSLHHGSGYSFQCLEDSNPKDNIKPMMLSFSSSERLAGRNMTFRFKDFSRYKTEEELKGRPESFEGTPGDENDVYNILIPGNWEITFPLNYRDNTAVYKLNKRLEYHHISLKVKEVRLSPISISMTLNTFSEVRSDDIHDAPLIIHMKNGETINADEGSRGTNTSTFKIVVDAQFNKIVNPAEIKSIEYCGTILPIKW
ncbi:DUF4179 domain-containing protein [Aminipila terrae]|uniref:DUF4179 domain-containing protein n=1 Tax=Aminipila terrae TaxID=2697030 RepID=A0A6P1MGY0_9FIRM|nr:DUF4179 domain-containing protein [Aminipila terrae]QHI73147.1 DUF4179 domain-containing protein [Aminipila terrae]